MAGAEDNAMVVNIMTGLFISAHSTFLSSVQPSSSSSSSSD